MTFNELARESSLMMAPVIPSEKYSCAGSPERLASGNTATEVIVGAATTPPMITRDQQTTQQQTEDSHSGRDPASASIRGHGIRRRRWKKGITRGCAPHIR